MSKKLFELLKILPGKGNPAKREVYRKASPGIYNFLIKKGYAKKANPEDVPKADEGKTLTQTNARRLIGNMAKEKGDQQTLDFLNKKNPADKPKSEKPSSNFEKEFNLDKNNAIKEIDNILSKLNKDFSKASPGIQKNIKRQIDKLNNKRNSIKNAKFSARAKANLENPLFDVTQDIKRTTTFMEDVVKNVSESRQIENQLSVLRNKYKKAKNKSEQDAIIKKAKNLLNQTTTYTQQDKSFALSNLANPEYGLATSRPFGGKGPREETAKRTGKTLNPSTDTVRTQKVSVDKKGKVIGKKPGTEPNVKKIQTSSNLEGSKLGTTGDVQDEAASIFKAAEQLRGLSKVSPAKKKQVEKQIQKYIEGGGKITKGSPSKGTAPDDTPGLRDSLVEAQRILGVDAPPGFAPNNVEREFKDNLIEAEGLLRQSIKSGNSKEIKKAQNNVIKAMKDLQKVRLEGLRNDIKDVYDLPSSQRKELKIGSSGIANPSNKKGAGPDADEPIEEMKKGGRLRKRKPKRVVRGVGAAKRGYGKANYSNKMY